MLSPLTRRATHIVARRGASTLQKRFCRTQQRSHPLHRHSKSSPSTRLTSLTNRRFTTLSRPDDFRTVSSNDKISEHEWYGLQQKMNSFQNVEQPEQRSMFSDLSHFQWIALATTAFSASAGAAYLVYEYQYNVLRPIVDIIRPHYTRWAGYQHLYSLTTPHPLTKVHNLEVSLEELQTPDDLRQPIIAAQRLVLKEVFKLYQYYDELDKIRLILPDIAPIPTFQNNHQHQLEKNRMYQEYLEAEQILFAALTKGYTNTLRAEKECLYDLDQILAQYRPKLLEGIQKQFEIDVQEFKRVLVEDTDRYQSAAKTNTPQGRGIVITPKKHKGDADETSETNPNQLVKNNDAHAQHMDDVRSSDKTINQRLVDQERRWRLSEQERLDRATRRAHMKPPVPPNELIQQLQKDDVLVLKHYLANMQGTLDSLTDQTLLCEALVQELTAQVDALKNKQTEYDRQEAILKMLDQQQMALEKAINKKQQNIKQLMDAQMNSNRIPQNFESTLMINGMTLDKIKEQREKINENRITPYDFSIDSRPLLELIDGQSLKAMKKLNIENLKEYWKDNTRYPDQWAVDMLHNDSGDSLDVESCQDLLNGLIKARAYLVKNEYSDVNQIPFGKRKPPKESLPPEDQNGYELRFWGCVDVELIHQLNEHGLTTLEKIQPTINKLDIMLLDHQEKERAKAKTQRKFIRMVSSPLQSSSDVHSV